MGLLRSSIQLGVAVTDEAVTVVSCTHKAHHIQAHKYAQIRLKRAETGEHADVDLEQVENALHSMVSALKIKNCECAMSIPLASTICGFFEVPKGQTRKQALALLKKHVYGRFSVPPHEVRFKEWAIPNSQEKDRFTFGYYAVERSVLDSWKAVYVRAGLRLAYAAVDMPSIAHMLVPQEKHDGSSGIAPFKGIVEVGERSTVCAIGGKEGLFFMGVLPWGMRDAYKKNDLSGLGGALVPVAAETRGAIMWHILAPDELLAPLKQFFIHHLQFEVSLFKMFMEIPPRFRVSAYVKASAAAGYPSGQCIIV